MAPIIQPCLPCLWDRFLFFLLAGRRSGLTRCCRFAARGCGSLRPQSLMQPPVQAQDPRQAAADSSVGSTPAFGRETLSIFSSLQGSERFPGMSSESELPGASGFSGVAALPGSGSGGDGTTFGVRIFAGIAADAIESGGAGSGVRNCRTVETRSLLSAFGTTCRTPTFWASNSICGDQCMVCISMGISGRSLEICRAALRPSITGITRSRMMRLGLSSWALASASRPFPTSTISQGPALCSRPRKAVLTTGLSSAISILGMLSGTRVETGGRSPGDSFYPHQMFDALRNLP